MTNKLIKNYENHLKFVQQMSKETIKAYLSDLNALLSIIENPLEVDGLFLNELFYKWSKEMNPTSLSRRLSAIRHFYQYCIETKELQNDPTELIKVSSQQKKLPQFYTLEEINQLLSFDCSEYDDYLDYALISVLFSCGLRVSEVININYSRFYRQEKFFNILGKGSKERIVPINQKALEAIVNYENNARRLIKSTSSMLFISSKSAPLSRQSVYNRLQKRRKQTGVVKELSPHVLRHSFASSMINNDADLRVVQELLGHEDISTTQIYTHLENKAKMRMYQQFHPGSKIKKGEDE